MDGDRSPCSIWTLVPPPPPPPHPARKNRPTRRARGARTWREKPEANMGDAEGLCESMNGKRSDLRRGRLM
jgi:hypothetical protein